DRVGRRRLEGADPRRPHLRAEPRERLPPPHRPESPGMNLKTFLAMLRRDAHVARRNVVQLALQTLLQPLMFLFVFGRVLSTSGLVSTDYKSLILPGIMATTMM